jgi:signal transduction histidine kinase/CheY-like chemotaxis protein
LDAHKGEIALANPTARAYLDVLAEERTDSGAAPGLRLTQLGGRPIDEFLAEASAATHRWIDIHVEQPFHIFEAVARPIGAHDRPLAWLIVLRDVTQERNRRAKEQTQERLATVGQLAAGIAHDFNNILTPIVIYTEFTRRSLPKEAEASIRHLGEVLKATTRAKELIMQILTFSRQRETGEHKPVRLQPIIRETLLLLRAGLPATIEIHEQIDDNAGPVLANSTQLHQVLMNLCTNAQHAMHGKGGTLTVALDSVFIGDTAVDAVSMNERSANGCSNGEQQTSRAGWNFALGNPHLANLAVGPYVRLRVCDTGHGMDSSTLARIFEPFFTTKQRGEGTGMGLAVVHGIVHAHGGEILVESAPGDGSKFTIYLPQYIQDIQETGNHAAENQETHSNETGNNADQNNADPNSADGDSAGDNHAAHNNAAHNNAADNEETEAVTMSQDDLIAGDAEAERSGANNAESAAHARKSNARTGGKRILIVDDEKNIALATQDVLESMGYQTTAVFSSLAALEAFRAEPDAFALMITDLTMPQMTGTTLAQEVLAIAPELRIIMISGYAEASVAEQVQTISPSAFLRKPFTIADLLQTVKRVLDEDHKP